MATKIIKSSRLIGRANHDGLSFHESDFLKNTKIAFERTQDEMRKMDGFATGPAKVYIIVEQEVIVNDD